MNKITVLLLTLLLALAPTTAFAASSVDSLPAVGTSGSVYPLPDPTLTTSNLWITQDGIDYKINPLKAGYIFLGPTPPLGPYLQQLWWNSGVNPTWLYYYNGSQWIPFPTGEGSACSIATVSAIGCVKPDGTTIAITMDGTISAIATCDIATNETVGCVKPDGTTITITEDGTLTATGLSGCTEDTGVSGQVCDSTGGGGSVWGQRVIGAAGTSPNGDGNAVTITGGAGIGTGNGAAVDVTGGTNGATGTTAGGVTVTGGAGFAGSDVAGGTVAVTGGAGDGTAAGAAVSITGGAGGATNATGGVVSVVGGAGSGNATGGFVNVVGGATATGNGGDVNITGGATGDNVGGQLFLTGGAGGDGGGVWLEGGDAVTDGSGGWIQLKAGAQVGADGSPGLINIFTQDADPTSSQVGGSITLTTGQGGNGFASGVIEFQTGDSTTGDSGDISISTGDVETASKSSGNVTIITGNNSSGSDSITGNVQIQTGTPANPPDANSGQITIEAWGNAILSSSVRGQSVDFSESGAGDFYPGVTTIAGRIVGGFLNNAVANIADDFLIYGPVWSDASGAIPTTRNGGNLWVTGGLVDRTGTSTYNGNRSGNLYLGGGYSNAPTVNDFGNVVFVSGRADQSYQFESSGASATIATKVGTVILDGVDTTYTLTLPRAPQDGRIVDVITNGAVSVGFTLAAPGGASVVNAPATLTAGEKLTAFYRSANTTWYVGN